MITFERRLTALAACLTLMAGTAVLAGGEGIPGLMITPPACLSVQEASPVTLRVEAPAAETAKAALDLVSEDGLVTVPVYRGPIDLAPGTNAFAIPVDPASLSPFAFGETVTLAGRVGPWAGAVDVPVGTAAGAPEAGGWVINAPPTALVYSSRDSTVEFRVFNPKNKPLSAKLALKFKNQKGKVVAAWKYPTLLPSGESLHTVTVPVAIGLKARLKGAVSLKTALKVKGVVRTTGQSLLDWDLTVTASADKTVGPAPLSVGFSGLATGGTAPYTYEWTFGDASAPSTSQSPSHTYTVPGYYNATLTVTDARGGVIAADPILIAVQ